MRDFYVALYSLEEFNNIADLKTVPIGTRTGGFSHLSLTNSNLLRHGNSFYLVVRGEDVTGFITTVSVGPVLVDQTPPTVNGSVYVQGTLDHVTVMWDSYAFSEPEEGDETISLRYAVGKNLLTSCKLILTSDASLNVHIDMKFSFATGFGVKVLLGIVINVLCKHSNGERAG